MQSFAMWFAYIKQTQLADYSLLRSEPQVFWIVKKAMFECFLICYNLVQGCSNQQALKSFAKLILYPQDVHFGP
jgi:hypothetical protein